MLENDVMKSKYLDGKDEGLKEGRAEGRAEGLAEGEAKGEHNKAIESARKMKGKGYPIADIAEITGLTVEDINSL
jgi:predicted transposase/invertase (TIGR01784 family)